MERTGLTKGGGEEGRKVGERMTIRDERKGGSGEELC